MKRFRDRQVMRPSVTAIAEESAAAVREQDLTHVSAIAPSRPRFTHLSVSDNPK